MFFLSMRGTTAGAGDDPTAARSKLGTYFEKGPNGETSLFAMEFGDGGSSGSSGDGGSSSVAAGKAGRGGAAAALAEARLA